MRMARFTTSLASPPAISSTLALCSSSNRSMSPSVTSNESCVITTSVEGLGRAVAVGVAVGVGVAVDVGVVVASDAAVASVDAVGSYGSSSLHATAKAARSAAATSAVSSVRRPRWGRNAGIGLLPCWGDRCLRP